MASIEKETAGMLLTRTAGVCASVLCIVAMLGASALANVTWAQSGEEGNTVDTERSTAPGGYGDMVRLPDETYIIGLTDEDPYGAQSAGRREITVSSFYIDRFEVTNEEYQEFVSEQGESHVPRTEAFGEGASAESRMRNYFYGPSKSDNPVVGITWEDAKAFCEWNGRRLPTEAEWEFAARSGRTGAIYPWRGISTTDPMGRYLANFAPSEGRARTGFAFTAPVGSFPPSRWGIHDIAGNVAEWVEDAYTPTYDDFPVTTDTPVVRPEDSEDNTRRVVRGGSWSSSAFEIGVGVRSYAQKDEASTEIGIRCAADPAQVQSGGAVGPDEAMDFAPPAEEGDTPPLENEEEANGENSPTSPDEEPMFPESSDENESEESGEGSEDQPPNQ